VLARDADGARFDVDIEATATRRPVAPSPRTRPDRGTAFAGMIAA
jgi:hypothetical protein